MVTKILHGLDGSPSAFKALAEAVTLARLTGAELHTISVEELPSYPGAIGETIEEKVSANGKFKDAISQAKAIAEKEGVKLKTHVIVGHEVKTIIEFTKAHGFDLLVLGFMGHSALYDRVMGSTCQNLVRLAPCSVLVVK
jgi:nucleotide-binding universal stress UspA family protein